MVSTDHYLVGRASRTRRPSSPFSGDLTRGLAGGAPWLLMEHSTSAVNWQPVNPAKAPGQTAPRQPRARGARRRHARLLPVARSRGRGRRSSTRRCVPHAGTRQRAVPRGRASSARSASASARSSGSRVEADVALLWDYQAEWAADGPACPRRELELPRPRRTPSTALLRDRGITADVVHPSADLVGYRRGRRPHPLPRAPTTLAAASPRRPPPARRCSSPSSPASPTEDDHVRLGGYPGAFRDLLGVRVEEFFPLVAGEHGGASTTGRPARLWSRGRAPPSTPRSLTGMRRARSPGARRSPARGHRRRRRLVPRHPASTTDAWRPRSTTVRPRPGRRAGRRVPPGVEAVRRAAPTARGSSCSTTPSAPQRGRRRTATTWSPTAPSARLTARAGRRRRGQGGVSDARQPAAGPRSSSSSGQRRGARVGAGRAARRLRHDHPPRHRAARRARAWCERVHGGATRRGGRSTDEPGFTAKSVLCSPRRSPPSPQAAAQLVEPGAAIGDLGRHHHLRAGPRSCADVPDLTVVTNSVPGRRSCCTSPAARARRSCSPAASARRPTRWSARWRSRRCATLHVDRLFLGVHGIDARAGLTTPNLVEAETNRALVATARQVVRPRRPHQVGDGRPQHDRPLDDGRPPGHRRGLCPPGPHRADRGRRRAHHRTEPRTGPDRADEDGHDRDAHQPRLADGREIIYFDDTPDARGPQPPHGHRDPLGDREPRRARCAATRSSASGSRWPHTG